MSGRIAVRRSTRRSNRRSPTRRTRTSASAWTRPPSRSSRAGRPASQALANKNAYALASADLFFTAKLAQHTIFFADVVALSGSPPDRQIPSLTLLNGYTARLVNQNELNLREAWLRTEFFGQRLALVAGRLDLTNYFDHNAAANDETTQFLADALVNNPTLGLSSNGTGFATVFDPKNGFNFKFGIQQSNPDARQPVGFHLFARRSRLRGETARARGRQLPRLVPLGQYLGESHELASGSASISGSFRR